VWVALMLLSSVTCVFLESLMSNPDLDNFTTEYSRKWGFLAALIWVPMYFLLSRYIDSHRAALCCVPFPISLVTIRFYWRLRLKPWLWFVVLLILMIVECVVIVVPMSHWSNSMSILGPVAIVDLTVNICVISWIDKALGKSSSSMT
jgi:hypothetical protein